MEKKIDGKTMFEGHIFKVTVDQVLVEENGNIASREIVHHNGGVAIIAIIDGCILLVKQYRYAYGEYTLEIPAGKIEIGEDHYNTGMREIEEETGYRVDSLKLITTSYPTPGYDTEIIYIYEAINPHKVENPLAKDEDEFIDVIHMPLEEAYEKILSLEIKDAKTVIAILYAYNKMLKK